MEKKTKLTVSGSAKKAIKNIEIAKTQGKNSVIIEKKSKLSGRSGSYKPNVYKNKSSSSFSKGGFNKTIIGAMNVGLKSFKINLFSLST